MRILIFSFSVLASLGLDPCGGADDPQTPAPNNPAQTTPGQTTTAPGQTTTAGQTKGNVAIPDNFYEDWIYETATSYEKDADPIVTGISGTAKFNRDLTYVQDYYIGTILNHFEGTYTVDGPDPKIAGAFFITTNDDGKPNFKLSCSVGDATTKTMVQRLYNDDGTPMIDYGLKQKEK